MTRQLPEIIYKYRNWTDKYHKRALTNTELYLSAPSDFNDPFDYKITKNHHSLNSPERIEKYIEKGINDNLEYLRAEKRGIEGEKIQLRKRFQNLDQYQREHEEINNENTDKYLGVLSLSGRWDSILMWSHYGDFHRGYCIGFDEEKLRNSGFFGTGGNVSYTSELPFIDPIEEEDIVKTSFYKTHYKAKDWEYEEEYRLTKLFYDKPYEEPNRLVQIPEEYIREVIIGLKISDEHKSEITLECKKRKIDIYQAIKEPYEFKIKREPISTVANTVPYEKP